MEPGMLLLNGGWQFLSKPFTSDLLKERIQQLLLQVTPKPKLDGV
jgi:hypothetical protein